MRCIVGRGDPSAAAGGAAELEVAKDRRNDERAPTQGERQPRRDLQTVVLVAEAARGEERERAWQRVTRRHCRSSHLDELCAV